MKIEEWLGEQNTLGIDIWKRKYQYEGESFDAWLDRVSGGDEDVKRLIKEKKDSSEQRIKEEGRSHYLLELLCRIFSRG